MNEPQTDVPCVHLQGVCEGTSVGTDAQRARAGICGERAAVGGGHPREWHQQDAVCIVHLWGLLQVLSCATLLPSAANAKLKILYIN